MFLLFAILVLAPIDTLAQEQNITCHVNGKCDGVFVGITVENDYNNCLNTCKDKTNCNWFTFFEDLNDCMQYSDCPSIVDDTNSYTGQKQCEPEMAKCGITGFCQGHVVSLNLTDSAEQCLELCQQFDNCNYYSYFSESNNCVLTEDCVELDQSCTDCTAGERGCFQETLSLDKLLIVGGQGAPYKVELVDLSVGGENRVCPPMPDYPGAYEGSVGTYINDRAMVCGGQYPVTNTCYFYNKSNDSWVRTVSMGQNRDYAAAVQLSSTEWWVTGGLNPYTNSTEVYNVEQDTFSPYISLPEMKAVHNLIQINSTHFMLLGGESNSNKTWMFDSINQLWNRVPDLLEARRETHAGLVKYPDGRQAVVVAGSNTPLSKTSEIFDLEEEIWKYGPDLPVELYLYGGSSVQYKDSFLIIGGFNGSNHVNTFYTFDPVTENWVELPQKLANGKSYFTAFLVPNEFAECT